MMFTRPVANQPIPADASRVFQGKIFSVFQWHVNLFDGSVATFEKASRPDTVLILPVLEDGRIVLSRQQQPGRPSFVSALGGRIEVGETVEAAAARELAEEAGYAAGEYVLWFSLHPTVKVDWVVYALVARGLSSLGQRSLDPGESVDLLPMTFDELLAVTDDPDFAEPEMLPRLLEARYVPGKRAALRQMLGLGPDIAD